MAAAIKGYTVFFMLSLWFNTALGVFDLQVQCDDFCSIYADGILAGQTQNFQEIYQMQVPTSSEVVAVTATNAHFGAGIRIDSSHIYTKPGRFDWKCTDDNFIDLSWTSKEFDDSLWTTPGKGNGCESQIEFYICLNIRNDGQSFWTENGGSQTVYCRGYLDECRSSPCINGGTCTDGADAFTCNCDNTGYTGVTCSDDVNECEDVGLPCKNNALCINTQGSYDCDCTGTGYTGPACEEDVNECNDTTACINNATCFNTIGSYYCNCSNTGYTGPKCQQELNECEDVVSPCKNNALCINTEGSYNCNCTGTGYTGPACEEDVNECTDRTACFNNAACSNTMGSYYCDCSNTGYTGPKCEQDIDECLSPQPVCMNCGVCVNSPGSFACDCNSTSFEGRYCQTLTGHFCEDLSSDSKWFIILGAICGILAVAVVVLLIIIWKQRVKLIRLNKRPDVYAELSDVQMTSKQDDYYLGMDNGESYVNDVPGWTARPGDSQPQAEYDVVRNVASDTN